VVASTTRRYRSERIAEEKKESRRQTRDWGGLKPNRNRIYCGGAVPKSAGGTAGGSFIKNASFAPEKTRLEEKKENGRGLERGRVRTTPL